MGRRRTLRVLGTVVAGLFSSLAFTPLANRLNQGLSVGPELGPADAIVVLGGGIHPDGVLSERSIAHALHGMALWRGGLAPLLVFSGPGSSGGESEARQRMSLALVLAIPRDRIVADSGGRTTRGEAASIRDRLDSGRVRSVLLVTDRRHLARARQAFERAGFKVFSAPPPDFLGGALSPQERLQLTRRIVEELAARAYYYITGFP
jgi:uncharacterized SAM-binding protein YcdF (DUF218 family)